LSTFPTAGNNVDADTAFSGQQRTGTDNGLNTIDSAAALFDEISRRYSENKSLKEQHECAQAYLRLCDMYYRCGYYTNAFSSASNALRIAEQNGFEDLLASAYNAIGSIYCTWHDYSLGVEYFRKGLSYSSPTRNPRIYKSLIINIQGAYIAMHKISRAKPYYNKMKMLGEGDPVIDFFLTLNNGLFLLEKKDNGNAIKCFRKATDIASRQNFDPSMLCSALDYMGDAYNCNDSSVYYWNKAINTPGIPAYLRLGILRRCTTCTKNATKTTLPPYTETGTLHCLTLYLKSATSTA